MRLVFDTAILVAAMRSRSGASRYLLRAALERRRGLTVLLSVPLLIEYEAVMTRPEHLKEANLSAQDVESLLDGIANVSTQVKLNYLWRPILPDADDDMVLETAVNGNADALITFNQRDFAAAKQQFGIEILLPGVIVERMEKRS